MAESTSAAESLPRRRRFWKTLFKRSVSDSNNPNQPNTQVKLPDETKEECGWILAWLASKVKGLSGIIIRLSMIDTF